jgi:hypothetical protein
MMKKPPFVQTPVTQIIVEAIDHPSQGFQRPKPPPPRNYSTEKQDAQENVDIL